MLPIEAINTKEGLSKQVETYEGFYQAVLERWKRCHADPSLRLKPFILLERLVSSERGHVHIFHKDLSEEPAFADCGPVTDGSVFSRLCNLPALVLAPADKPCTRCGKGWTLKDVSDIWYTFVTSNDDQREMYPEPPDDQAKLEEFTYQHRACHDQELAEMDAETKQTSMKSLIEFLSESGFEDIQASWAPLPKRVLNILNRDNLPKEEFFEPDENNCDMFVEVQTRQGALSCVLIDITGVLILDLTDTGITREEISDYESVELFPLVGIVNPETLKRINLLMSRNQT